MSEHQCSPHCPGHLSAEHRCPGPDDHLPGGAFGTDPAEWQLHESRGDER